MYSRNGAAGAATRTYMTRARIVVKGSGMVALTGLEVLDRRMAELRDYRGRAERCRPTVRSPALAWESECSRRFLEIRSVVAIGNEYRQKNQGWEQEHSKPPVSPEHDQAWLAWDAAHRDWVKTEPPPVLSAGHLRAWEVALRSLKSWTSSNPAPTLDGSPGDIGFSTKVNRSVMTYAQRALEDALWHEGDAAWRRAHPEPTLPPAGSGASCLLHELAYHAWINAHPHPGETEEKRTKRREEQSFVEARWRRLAARYP